MMDGCINGINNSTVISIQVVRRYRWLLSKEGHNGYQYSWLVGFHQRRTRTTYTFLSSFSSSGGKIYVISRKQANTAIRRKKTGGRCNCGGVDVDGDGDGDGFHRHIHTRSSFDIISSGIHIHSTRCLVAACSFGYLPTYLPQKLIRGQSHIYIKGTFTYSYTFLFFSCFALFSGR